MRTLGLFFRVVKRDRLLIICGLFIFIVVGLPFTDFALALAGIHFTGYTYDQISDASLLKPSWAHWFGTDVNGHDLLTRTLYGAQISLFVAAMGTIVSLTVGVTYGMISGYAGGRVDNLMMRVVEIIYSLPTLVLVIVLVTTLDAPIAHLIKTLGADLHYFCRVVGITHLVKILGADFDYFCHVVGIKKTFSPMKMIDSLAGTPPRLILIVVFLGLTEWLTMARIIRGQVLVLKEQPFVQASHALGQSHVRILWQHLFPNLSGIIIVYLTLTIPAIMLDESFMSFLGVGVPAPLASWGTLVSDAASLINPIRFYWWMLIFPGGFMTLTLLALNFLGDGLRDALDPRVKK